jgi:probable HAF family extracellular repeat protein
MKRIASLLLVLCVYCVPAVRAQQAVTKPPIGRHLSHPTARQTPSFTVGQSVDAAANPEDSAKIWELATYPGGTWFASWRLNDLGVIVGRGDVPPIGSGGVGYTHTLAVALSGPDAGKWIDLGTLGGEEPMGWEEPNNDVSNTGLVVSRSTAPDGQVHGVAWTKGTGMVDLGTLADTGEPQYASYNSSFAAGTNKFGTLIVGQSWDGVDGNQGAPVVWTPSNVWMNGKFITKWEIHKLDTTAFSDLTGFVAWGVNDYGQITGTGWNSDFTIIIGALWNPRADGKGWDLITLPPSPALPSAQTYGINNRGEIVGVANSADQSIWLPRLWKPLDRKRTTYSQPVELPLPKGFTGCECVGINELGDLVGDCWNDRKDLPTRWTTEDLNFAEIIKFPGTTGFSWGVNNNRIAVLTYLGGGKCAANTYGSCGGAIQLQ